MSLAKLNQATLTPLANFGLHEDASPTLASVGPTPPELLLELPELDPLEEPELEPLELPELDPLEEPELEPLELPELDPLEEPEAEPLELLELDPLEEPELVLPELLERPLELPELDPLEEPELVLLDAPELPLELLDVPPSVEEPGVPPLLSSPHPKAPTKVIITAALATSPTRMCIPFWSWAARRPRRSQALHVPRILDSFNPKCRSVPGQVVDDCDRAHRIQALAHDPCPRGTRLARSVVARLAKRARTAGAAARIAMFTEGCRRNDIE